MDEPLALEWAAYRAACDAVDALRGNPVFSDPRAGPERLRRATERLLIGRRSAVAASERLIGRAEREPDIDPDWLDELRDEHDLLVRAAARSERQLARSAILA
ncbi:MAG: hypothetical protein M3235_03750 [Actinomycetota bacterium]|nr:hypothetical protein [Actinomycetota bacterium]